MLINLTPHDIDVLVEGKILTIEPSGDIARLVGSDYVHSHVLHNGKYIPIMHVTYTEVKGLPPFNGKDTFIVSSKVQEFVKDRGDLISPDTGDSAIRENGKITAIRAFSRLA
jgi:hypothetical protein